MVLGVLNMETKGTHFRLTYTSLRTIPFAYLSSFSLQIIIWFVIPAIKYSTSEHNNNILVLIVLAQYLPRLYLIFPLTYEIVKTTGVVAKTAWEGAAYNLVLYLIASHV
jgi:hypothetical protein